MANEDPQLHKDIISYFAPEYLVKALIKRGGFLNNASQEKVGIGFIDIVGYTDISRFLSPQENRILLNGLYTALEHVIRKRGGYVNKVEGDSLMFNFGGIDPLSPDQSEEHRIKEMAGALFYTCIDMQRITSLLNDADEEFLKFHDDSESQKALEQAFEIIRTIRNREELISTLQAFFQIRIRIGANIGEVMVGAIGPSGSKKWDFVGLPVINAKRMESTAPVGGLRISAEFYEILRVTGVADTYYERFKRIAGLSGGVFKDITKDELFAFRRVLLKEKKGAEFDTFSVQVNPTLPESVATQVENLLFRGREGARRIVSFLKYYRGNRYVLKRLEELFEARQIAIDKAGLIKLIHPKYYQALENKQGPKVDSYIQKKVSFYALFTMLGRYQDVINDRSDEGIVVLGEDSLPDLVSTPDPGAKTLHRVRERQLRAGFEKKKSKMMQRAYFYEVLFPLVFESFELAIINYQHGLEDGDEATGDGVELLDDVEELDEV